MKKLMFLFIVIICVFFSGTGVFCMGNISFEPVSHASFVIKLPGYTVYVDPVGDKQKFANFPAPDLILITDIHQDHLNNRLVSALRREKADSATLIGLKPLFKKTIKFGSGC